MRRASFIAGLALVIVGGGLVTASYALPRGNGALELRLANKSTLITAAYKVYGNKEAVQGKYWLGKLTLTNTGDAPLDNVAVSYQIPSWLTWTTPETYPELLPHQTAVVAFYPKLPASVTTITSMTPASLEVKIDYDDRHGHKSRVEHRDFQFRGVHELEYTSLPRSEIVTFYDLIDNSELNSAWVTEEDPVVRVFYTKASELGGGFGMMKDAKEVEQLARTTYNLMVALGMTYSGTKGLPEKKGDELVAVQSMRLPRDVIIGNSGLCIELAQLWCSIGINAGAGCYIVLIPGHAIPVLKAQDGSLLPVESTAIGGSFEGGNLGRAASFEEAVKSAQDTLGKAVRGEIPAQIVDVLEYRNEGIRPPELPDIDRTVVLKQLDDRLRERAQAAAHAPQAAAEQPAQPAERAAPRETQQAAGGRIWQDPRGRLALRIPNGWRVQEQTITQMRQVLPGYALSLVNPRTSCGSDIIFFDGADSGEQVVQTLVSTLERVGAKVQLGQSQRQQLGGKEAVAYMFQMQVGQGTAAGIIMAVHGRDGMIVVTVGGPMQNLQAAMPEFQQLMQSMQIAR